MELLEMESKPAEREPILALDNVTKWFEKGSKLLRTHVINRAVRNVHLEVRKGEALGLVGESGCGKSTLGKLIVRLYDCTDGTVHFEGQDLTRLTQTQLQPIRKDMQMIFQDPYASLNPRMTVRQILTKPFLIHGIPYTPEAIVDIAETVGITRHQLDRYPHEFSGGQRQRIGIGRAVALHPKFIVCDEPVSALDVSVQAQILNLMMTLKDNLGLTYLFISHDLGVVKHLCDRIAVMYLGNIVEVQTKETLYRRPLHPYTQALMSAIPVANPLVQKQQKPIVLKGEMPSPLKPPTGCPFHPRCPHAQEKCRLEQPTLTSVGESQQVACHFPLN